MERGLQMPDIRKMTIGQVVDFIEAYNKRQKEAEKHFKEEAAKQKKARPVKHYRLATQEEIDALKS